MVQQVGVIINKKSDFKGLVLRKNGYKELFKESDNSSIERFDGLQDFYTWYNINYGGDLETFRDYKVALQKAKIVKKQGNRFIVDTDKALQYNYRGELEESFNITKRKFIKESDYSNYKERISDYLDENGLWVDNNQLDELSHSIGNRDYKFDVCIDCNSEEWFWTCYYDSKHSRSSAYINTTLTINSRLSYSNATYMLERIYRFVEFLNELY